jgi:hypothetical protein
MQLTPVKKKPSSLVRAIAYLLSDKALLSDHMATLYRKLKRYNLII